MENNNKISDQDQKDNGNVSKVEVSFQNTVEHKNTSLRWKPENLEDINYTVTIGNHKPVAEYISHQLQKQPTTFYNYCFICSGALHSQNECPIRQCRYCLEFGHSTKFCPLLRRF